MKLLMFVHPLCRRWLPVAAGIVCLLPGLVTAAQSEWAHLDADGKLTYKALPGGDRIMDFSYAGYGGGSVKLPVVPVQKTVAPSTGDDSAAIQAAAWIAAESSPVEGATVF